MTKRLGITLRIGADYDTVITADGAVFDRSRMDRPTKHKLTRLVRDLYEKHLERINGKEAENSRSHARRRFRIRVGRQAGHRPQVQRQQA